MPDSSSDDVVSQVRQVLREGMSDLRSQVREDLGDFRRGVNGKLDELHKQGSRIETRLGAVESRLGTVESRLGVIETRLGVSELSQELLYRHRHAPDGSVVFPPFDQD